MLKVHDSVDFFRPPLAQMIDLRHLLVALESRLQDAD
jgi:hypothetical protein